MSIFHRRKKENTSAVVTHSAKLQSELEEICGNDKDTYQSLVHTMFLDPRKIDVTIKDAVENAKKYEKSNNPSRARIWYDIAGGISIYEGNPKKVIEYYSEAARLSGLEYPIVKNAEKAVAKAQEFYKRHLKEAPQVDVGVEQ